MKKKILYISIVVLYLLTPVGIMGTLGTMVSLKYEVDANYWRIDGNDNLTADQKRQEIMELDNQGSRLKMQAFMFAFFAFAAFVTATGLIINRKQILGVQKSSV